MNGKSNTNVTEISSEPESEIDDLGVLKDEYYDILTTEDCFDYDVANNIVLGYN